MYIFWFYLYYIEYNLVSNLAYKTLSVHIIYTFRRI